MGAASQIAAKKSLNWLLRVRGLPPLTIPPIVVPFSMRRQLPVIRRGMSEAIAQVRNEPARRWLREKCKYTVAKLPTWHDQVNAKKVLQGLSTSDAACGPRSLGLASRAADLRASLVSWRLPIWPSRRRVVKDVRERWSRWADLARLPLRVRRFGRGAWERCFVRTRFREPPAAWAQHEECLRQDRALFGLVLMMTRYQVKLGCSRPCSLKP